MLSSLLIYRPALTFSRAERKPTWGTCAGLILLAEAANSTKKGGQDLIGGLDVRVNRNHFGRQIESFQADVSLPFLAQSNESTGATSSSLFPGIFIRAPIVEKILPSVEGVQVTEEQVPNSIVAPSRQVKTDIAQAATSSTVEVMAILSGRMQRAAEKGAIIQADEETGDIIAVRQGNVFGTSFHPELTSDPRIHVWWLGEVVKAIAQEA